MNHSSLLTLLLVFFFSSLTPVTHAQMGRDQLAERYYDQAITYHDLSQSKEAIAYYSEAIFMNPLHEKAMFNRGLLYLDAGQLRQAKVDFDRLLMIAPNDTEALELNGQVHYEMGDYQKAIDYYSLALRLDEKSELYANRALARSRSGQLDAALQDIQAALRLNPENQTAFSFKGDVLTEKGAYQEAIQSYDMALSIDPTDQISRTQKNKLTQQMSHQSNNQAVLVANKTTTVKNASATQLSKARFAVGLLKYKLKDYPAALNAFDEAIQLDNTQAKHHEFKAHALLKLKAYEAAIQSFDQAVEAGLYNSKTLSDRGVAKYMVGDYESALYDQKEAILLAPNNMKAYERMNQCYYSLAHGPAQQVNKSPLESIRSTGVQMATPVSYNQQHEAVKADPVLSNDDLLQKALFLNRAEKYEEAIGYFNELIEKENKNKVAFNGRGYAYYKVGELEVAHNDFVIALGLDPNYIEAWYQRGIVEHEMKNYEVAITSFDKAIQLKPSLAVAMYMKGQTYNKMGRTEAALDAYEKCIKADPLNTMALNNRGAIKLMLGDSWGAIEDFSQAIVIKPSQKITYRNRAKARSKVLLYEKAIEDINVVLEDQPNSDELLYERALSWQALQAYGQAKEDMDRAIKYCNSEKAAYYYQRGLSYHYLRNFDKALMDYNRSIELKSDYAAAYYNRATVRRMMDDEVGACEDYELAQTHGLDASYFGTADRGCQ